MAVLSVLQSVERSAAEMVERTVVLTAKPRAVKLATLMVAWTVARKAARLAASKADLWALRSAASTAVLMVDAKAHH